MEGEGLVGRGSGGEDWRGEAHIHGWSFSFVGMGGSLRLWAVVFVQGRLSLFGGVRLCSWAVRLRLWATAGCGGGEPLVGGGESSGLA